MHKHYDFLVRATGLLLFARGALFFVSALTMTFMRGMAVPSTLNEVMTPIFFLFGYIVYVVILGMRLYGVFLGGHGVLFREKLDSYNFSNYKEGSEYTARREAIEKGLSTKDIDIKKIESLNVKRPSAPVSHTPKPLTIAILLLIDLALAITFELMLGDLPRLYTIMAIEAIMIILALREKMYE